MDLSPSSLAAGLIFGTIGLFVFRRGKKRASLKLSLTGVAMMIYPYFARNALMEWGFGFLLCGVAYFFWQD